MGDFEGLYRKHIEAVFRYTFKCVGRREIAEEITSEVFLLLYQNMKQLDEKQLPAWLLTVAKNRAIDYWRRQAVEENYAGTLTRTAVDPAFPREVWLLDSKALKPVHRACLILRYIHGMERGEIARRIGLSSDQVKSCLQYARRLLRQQVLAAPADERNEKTG